jgi:hypothetical protein
LHVISSLVHESQDSQSTWKKQVLTDESIGLRGKGSLATIENHELFVLMKICLTFKGKRCIFAVVIYGD